MPFNYKKVIGNQERRRRLLQAFDWVPDEVMVRMQYRIKTGRRLDIDAPRRYTEKLQWMKLHYRDPLMARCANKEAVREYVEACGLSDLLVPLVGVYASSNEIEIEALPSRFVAKDSLGGGNNEVVVCRDKAVLDKDAFRETVDSWIVPGRHCKHPGREWVYDSDEPSKIVIEQFLEPDEPNAELVDYKFFFFNGKARYLYVLCDRLPGRGGQLGVFVVDSFEQVNAYRVDERQLACKLAPPPNYKEMVKMAARLAAPFPHVRVDLYDLGKEGGVRFGELTFFDGSGYFAYSPDEFDFTMGSLFELPERNH